MYILNNENIIDVDILIDETKIDEIINKLSKENNYIIFKQLHDLLLEMKSTKSIFSLQQLLLYKNLLLQNNIDKNSILENYVTDVIKCIKIIKNNTTKDFNVHKAISRCIKKSKKKDKEQLEQSKKVYFDAISNTNMLIFLGIKPNFEENKIKIKKRR